jgi:carbamoyl-phosphate synthase large subunit
MKKHLNVLVTGLGSVTALSVIKGLRLQKEYDVSIIGVDTNDRTDIAGTKFCDKFFKVPPAIPEENYINEIRRIAETEYIDLLIPIVDAELEVIAKNVEKLKAITNVLISSYNTIITCNDKFLMYKCFKNLGIPTPKTISFDGSDAKELIDQAGISYPLIIKPRKGVSSRDVYEVTSDDYINIIKKLKNPVIQEKVCGEEYTIDIFSDGECLISAVPRKRIETRSGISYKGLTVKDDELINFAKIIADNLKFYGPANIQCFKHNDEVKFFEINPRFSGSLPLTTAAGINEPLFALKMANGEKIKPNFNFKSVKMCRYWEEVFYYEF